MRSVPRRLVFTAFAGSLVVMWSAHHLAAQRSKAITMTRLYTGPDGQTHAGKTEVNLRPSTLRAGLDESAPLKVSGAQILRWPSGYVWDWHTATPPVRNHFEWAKRGRSRRGTKDSTQSRPNHSSGGCDGQRPHHALYRIRGLGFVARSVSGSIARILDRRSLSELASTLAGVRYT